MASVGAAAGQLIAGRYRLEQCLSQGSQGDLWRASDQLAAEAPLALRRLTAPIDLERAALIWGRLQGVLHPQVPRLGAAIRVGEVLWLVREWQSGRTYQQLAAARAERQLVFGAGEVLLLLRQLLPVLAVLHGQELVHGDLCPANLLRRDSDGLPVLLDFGLVSAAVLATPGYAPPERARGATAQPWMDLYGLGVTALVLLSGDPPEKLLDPVSLQWRWPAALTSEPQLQGLLARFLAVEGSEPFATAAQALSAAQALPMPDSTGPVPRADRTVALVPPPTTPAAATPAAAPAAAAPAAAAASPAAASPEPPPREAAELQLPPLAAPPPARSTTAGPGPRSRADEREQAAEGSLWPVVIALVLSAVVGTALGWWWLGRGKPGPTTPDVGLPLPSTLPPAEVDQRQQLLNRLVAMQVDRSWFLSLVDASLLARFPERGGRLPSDAADDAPLRKVWNELAEEWLARVEQLPIEIRRRLGSFSEADWQRRQAALVGQGLSAPVLRQLVSGSAQNLLPGRPGADIPPEPFRQLWFAAAEQSLASVRIEAITAEAQQTRMVTTQVDAGGARLFPIRLPAGYRLVLGVNGSPLMQMAVFGPGGDLLDAKGPLRVVSLPAQKASPVQLLITNDGVAPGLITLSLRADPPAAQPAPSDPQTAEPQTPVEPPPSSTPPPGPAPVAPPPPVPPSSN
jgi:serine/threonine-protein kinase